MTQPWRRTHTCGELREAHVGQTVVLNGWVNTYRAYNDQIFVDLRDRYGITQVVTSADEAPAAHQAAAEARNEWVVQVSGAVRHRPEGTTNPELPTGEVSDHSMPPLRGLFVNQADRRQSAELW